MKHVFLILILFLDVLSLRAQNKVTITASLKGLPAGIWVVGQRRSDGLKKDSVKTIANGFTLTIPIAEGEGDEYVIWLMSKPEIAHVKVLSPEYGMIVYLDKGAVRIEAPGPDFTNAVVTGGQAITDLQVYKDYLTRQLAQSTNAEPMKKMEEMQEATSQWILQHPGSPVSGVLLSSVLGNLDLDKQAGILEKLSPEAKNNRPTRRLANAIEAKSVTGIGKPAPDFTQSDTAGKPVSLRDFRGKYVLVDFWASWCGPCRAESPNVVAAFRKYKDRKFTVLGVSLDGARTKGDWLEAIHKDGLSWTQVSDLRGWGNSVAYKYGVLAIPVNFLVDPKGIIVARNLRGDELEKKLQEILAGGI